MKTIKIDLHSLLSLKSIFFGTKINLDLISPRFFKTNYLLKYLIL